MLGVIAGVLLVLWLLGFLIFHVTAGAIHLLLVSAVVLFVLHLLKGRGVICAESFLRTVLPIC